MMHMLAINSITSLLNAFATQLLTTPSVASIQGWTVVLDEIPDVMELDVSSSTSLKERSQVK